MAGEIQAAFNAVYSDGPSTEPDQPQKSRIRQEIGGLLEAQVSNVNTRIGVAEVGLSDANAAIADLEDQISQIETGSADGIIVADTLANLNARATALGLGAGDAGRGGRVYDDGTVANNGDYQWTGSAWSFLGADRIGQNEANILSLTRQTMQLTCNREIIIDRENLIGGGAAAYIPDQLRLLVNGTAVINVNLTSDAKMTGWQKIAISTDTTLLQTIYYDVVDAAVKVAIFPAAMPVDGARYFHIVSLRGSQQGWAGNNRISSTQEWRATFLSEDPVVFDDNEGKLYVPYLRGLRGGGNLAWNLQPVATTDKYREIAVATTGSAVFVWVDVYACVANSRDPNAVITSTGYTNRPSRDGTALVLLGVVFGHHFTPANPDLRLANMVPNQFGAGREDNDKADLVFGTSAPVDLVKAESLALGFTRGYAIPSGTAVYYGGNFTQPRNTGFLFYRFYIETDVADDFAIPRWYLHERLADGSTSLHFAGASVEKQHSSYLREYSGYVALPDNGTYFGAWFGTSGMTQTGIRVFGVQFHLSPTLDAWIGKKDYPRLQDEIGARLRKLELGGGAVDDLDPIVPPKLYIHPDRPYRIYPDQMFGATMRGGYRLVAQSLDETYGPLFTKEVTGGTLDLPTAGIGGAVDFNFHTAADNDSKKMGSASVVMLSPSAIDALTFNILFQGDSITDWNGTAVQTVRRLTDMGATVTTIGSMTMTSSISGDGTVLGEGRSGRRMADFIGMTQDRMAFLPAGQEAMYLALDTEGKRGYNPCLKEADADDIANRSWMIFNGYIYDLAYGLSRLGLAAPDVVVINLFTNDAFNETPAVAAANVATGLRIMATQSRRAVPGVKIVIAFNARGYSSASDDVWKAGFRACLLEYLKFTLEDGDVTLVPGWCTINRLTGFTYSLTTDPDTGLASGILSEGTHYGPSGLREYSEVLAQFIAGAMTE